MSKYTGTYLNDEICRAVGINPSSVYRVIVDLKVGEIAKVTTHGFVETDDGKIDRLTRVLKHYELKPKQDEKLVEISIMEAKRLGIDMECLDVGIVRKYGNVYRDEHQRRWNFSGADKDVSRDSIVFRFEL